MLIVEKKEIPEDCTTCLYGGYYKCANANRQQDWPLYALGVLVNCPSWWLDHQRYQKAD